VHVDVGLSRNIPVTLASHDVPAAKSSSRSPERIDRSVPGVRTPRVVRAYVERNRFKHRCDDRHEKQSHRDGGCSSEPNAAIPSGRGGNRGQQWRLR